LTLVATSAIYKRKITIISYNLGEQYLSIVPSKIDDRFCPIMIGFSDTYHNYHSLTKDMDSANLSNQLSSKSQTGITSKN
jgi:hypothetical protein